MADINIFAPELRNVVRKEVSFIPGAWVDFYDDIKIGMVTKAQRAKDSGDMTLTLEIIADQIADWNFADGENSHMPINLESIEKLPIKILLWLSKAQEEVISDISISSDKKKV
jgi:hypothetical protein